METPATATTTESMGEGEWYASRPTPPQPVLVGTSPTTATHSDGERYPRPDLLDPFAPLWALRDKSRSASMDGGQRKPWMVEASSSPWAMAMPGSPVSSLGEGRTGSQNHSSTVFTSAPNASSASSSSSSASAYPSSNQGKALPPERRPSSAMGVIRASLSSDRRNLVDGSLYAKPAVLRKDVDHLSRLPPPTSRSPASPSSSRMSYISRQSVSPTRSLESSASGHRRFPTSTAPPVVTKAVTEGSVRYPTPNPLDPFAPLSALRSMSLDGRKRPAWTVEAGLPGSPATSASSSLPRTPPSSDGTCFVQRPSTASSIPTSFRSPVSTPASSFKHGYHRPAVVRPRTMETCSSTWASSANTVILPDEMGNLQRPSEGGVSPILLSTDSHVVIQDQRSTPVVGSKDLPPPKLKRNRLSKLFLGLKRPSTSSGVPVDKENGDHSTLLAFRPFQRVRTLSLQPTTANHLNGNHDRLIQPRKTHSNDHHQRRASLVKATISPPVVSTAVWQSQMTGRQCLPITASPLLNTAISVQPQAQDELRQQHASENAPLDTLVNDASIRHGRLIGNDAAAFDINSLSPSNQASLPIPSSPPRSTLTGTMQGDSGVELQQTQDGQQINGVNGLIRGVGATLASRPRGPRKPASLHLDPIETRTSQSTSTSSYIEIFSTPNASPLEDSFQARVSPATPPRAPQLSSMTSKGCPPNSALLSPPPLMTPFATSPQSASSTKAQCLCSTTIPVPQPPQTEWALPTKAQLTHAASLPIYQSDGTPIQFGTLFVEHRAIVLFLRHFFCPMCQDYVSSLSSLVKHPMLKELGALCDFNDEDARAALDDPENGELLPRQVQLVLISCGKATLVKKYKHMFGLPFRMFADPEMKVYEALGMGKMGDAVNGGDGKNGLRTREGDPPSPVAGTPVQGRQRCEWHDGESMRSPSSAHSSTTGSSAMTTDSEGRGRRGGYVRHGLMGGIAMVVMRALKAGMPMWENGGDIAQLGGEFVLGPGLACSFAHRMQDPKGHAPVVDVLSAANVKIPEEVLDVPGPSAPHKTRKLKSKSQERSVKGKENADGRLTHRGTQSLSLSQMGGRSSSLDMQRYGKQTPDSDTSMGTGAPLVQKRKRESFVTATLRSMGDNIPPGFRNVAPHTIGEDSLSVVSESTIQDHSIEPYPRAKGFYADTRFVPYSGSPPTRPESHLDREQAWMEFRQKDLETLRQRKDDRRRTGNTSSIAGSLITSSPSPSAAVKLAGNNDQRESYYVNQASINESVSVDLSQLEFGPGSTENLNAKAGGSSEGSSTSTTKSAKAPMTPTFKDDLDDLDEMDFSGVVAVGGFIQVPRNVPKKGGGTGALGKLPKSVQAAIDLDLQMGAAGRDLEKIAKAKPKKGGRERSFSASVMNLFRSS